MRFIVNILLCFSCFGLSATGQNVERKIIVENGLYYYITVDDNYQVGTMYTGAVDEELKNSKTLALPVGRGISGQTNPLAWDINGAELIAVNFLDHSLNDRNEAIKRISMSDLEPWMAGLQIEDMIMRSVDQEMYALNEPYLFIKKRSKYMNHFYFDGIAVDNNYWMVVTNNGELTVWKYDGSIWNHSDVIKFPVTNYVSLLAVDSGIQLIDPNGATYSVSLNGLSSVQAEIVGFDLSQVILIENRDTEKILYIKNSQLNINKSLSELMNDAGIELIKK